MHARWKRREKEKSQIFGCSFCIPGEQELLCKLKQKSHWPNQVIAGIFKVKYALLVTCIFLRTLISWRVSPRERCHVTRGAKVALKAAIKSFASAFYLVFIRHEQTRDFLLWIEGQPKHATSSWLNWWYGKLSQHQCTTRNHRVNIERIPWIRNLDLK